MKILSFGKDKELSHVAAGNAKWYKNQLHWPVHAVI